MNSIGPTVTSRPGVAARRARAHRHHRSRHPRCVESSWRTCRIARCSSDSDPARRRRHKFPRRQSRPGQREGNSEMAQRKSSQGDGEPEHGSPDSRLSPATNSFEAGSFIHSDPLELPVPGSPSSLGRRAARYSPPSTRANPSVAYPARLAVSARSSSAR